jgi:NADH-quinone oxidoreductase subunit N
MSITEATALNLESLFYIGPELIVTATLLLLLGVSVLVPDDKKRSVSTAFAFIGLTAALVALIRVIRINDTRYIFHEMMASDPMALLFKTIFLGATLIVAFMILDSEEIPVPRTPEFFALVLTVFIGMSLLGGGVHLLILYLGLEIVSLPSYVLAGFNMPNRNSAEAGLKYLLYGAVAGGTFIFGSTLLYGVTGSFKLAAIASALSNTEQFLGVTVALIFMLVGIGYKCSFFPMHMWVPDVYQGAPAAVGGFLSTAPKAAGFAVLIRLSMEFVPALVQNPNVAALSGALPVLFFLVSVVTMTVGNLSALAQDNVKRLLGYSTIAHVGYITMAYSLVGTRWMTNGFSAIAFYLIVYTVMNLGAFLVVVALDREWLDELDGMAKRAPIAAISMGVFLFSLTGIPPLAGFAGKFVLFSVLLESGRTLFQVLALVGVINSVISFFYYAKILEHMFLNEPESEQTIEVSPLSNTLLVGLSLMVILLGVFWSPVVTFTRDFMVFV